MKILLLILFSVLNLLCAGQLITLDNTWIAGSKMIFIGVGNKLILRGQVDKLVSFQSDRAKVERNGDTLIVKPTQPGPLAIILKTTDQTISQEFTVGYLPMFSLVISDDPVDANDIRRENVLNAKNIYLVSKKSDIRLYEGYVITECILRTDEQLYKSPGNSLSEEVKRVIAGLASGSVIKLEQITAKSESTGKEMKFKSNQSFTIL